MAGGIAPVGRPGSDAPLTAEPRLFVAVPIAEPARAAVAEIVEPIRAAEPPGRGVRWVRLDGLHVTLRFLGPTVEERIDPIRAAMRRAARGIAPFSIRLHEAGAFPPTGRPRTLWLGIDAGREELARLSERLNGALAEAGWPVEERPFRAHLTLARADGVRAGPDTAASLRRAAVDLAVDSHVDRLVLYESITGGGPARYVERGDASLG